ncbi:MAG: NAD(+) diphosphatase [Pseudomonadales bacterium]|jgi:NAD+ diphosphatase
MAIWPEPNIEFQSVSKPPESYQDAWYFILCKGAILLNFADDGAFKPLTLAESEIVESLKGKQHFMGMHGEIACFAVEAEDSGEHTFGNLRAIFGKADNILLALAGKAQQICEWYRTHQYCGRCGKKTIEHHNDRAMVCEDCKIFSYPRLSPSIIVLVHRDREVLLARNHGFPEGMYSTLAGFVEPGESIEETLVREVREEVGVTVGNLEYLGSQPWPFPNSLMLGFHAKYESGDIKLQEEEIADAQWFPIDDLPTIPGNIAISRWLINDYLAKNGIPV